MQRFDCLALDCPLFGSHLLEASAGTGKTFSIEHIFVRFILEGVELEQILAVTFTRAATRELKARIRGNLERALYAICTKETEWGYLRPHLGSDEAIRRLSDALTGFDRCQIFTIHGFCYRVLKEFSFEANIGSLLNPEEQRRTPERLKRAILDFLEQAIDPTLLCDEQLARLTRDYSSMQELSKQLLLLENPEKWASFTELSERCKAVLHDWKLEEGKLLEDFRQLEKNYKM